MLRFDRLTLMMTMSVENSELTLRRLNELFKANYLGHEGVPQENLEPWKRFASGIENGKPRYSFDVVGLQAELAAMTLPPNMWANVRRLDYKWIGRAATVNWIEVYRYIQSVVPDGTRLTMFSSKMDDKKTTSSLPPGRGIRIGSHESDRSMVIYQKGDALSIEVQMQKKTAKTIADDCINGGGDPYDNARSMADAQLASVLRKAGFASISHLVGVLETEAPVRQTLFDVEPMAFHQATPRQQIVMMLEQVLQKLREIEDKGLDGDDPSSGYAPYRESDYDE